MEGGDRKRVRQGTQCCKLRSSRIRRVAGGLGGLTLWGCLCRGHWHGSHVRWLSTWWRHRGRRSCPRRWIGCQRWVLPCRGQSAMGVHGVVGCRGRAPVVTGHSSSTGWGAGFPHKIKSRRGGHHITCCKGAVTPEGTLVRHSSITRSAQRCTATSTSPHPLPVRYTAYTLCAKRLGGTLALLEAVSAAACDSALGLATTSSSGGCKCCDAARWR